LGHVAALAKIEKDHLRYRTFNLGSGVGVSVLQLVETFGKITGTSVPYEIKPRREGDICAMYANGSRAKNELGWQPRYNLEQMCQDFWRWQTMNPKGYRNEVLDSNSSKSVNGSNQPSVDEGNRS